MKVPAQGRPSFPQKSAAFTFLELLSIILIIGILISLLLPGLEKGKKRARRAECINNLKQLGIGFHGFAHDHGDQFPFQVPVKEGGTLDFVKAVGSVKGDSFFAYRHFQALSNELLTPKILVCPTDQRTNASTFGVLLNHNISYFAGATALYTKPDSILSGDRNISDGIDAGALLRLSTNAAAAWTSGLHEFKGNLLFADSRVEAVGNGGLVGAVYNSGLPVNTLLPPLTPANGQEESGSSSAGIDALQQYFRIPANTPTANGVPSPSSPAAAPNPAAAGAGSAIPVAATPIPSVPGEPTPPRTTVDPRRAPLPVAPLKGATNNEISEKPDGATNKNHMMAMAKVPGLDDPAEASEPATSGVLAVMRQPERCWTCWIVAMAVAIVSAFLLVRHVARQRMARRRSGSALGSARAGGGGSRL